jgi:Fe-Mn family superoxide dismutase
MNYRLPKLPYSYDALEPYIDKTTMTIHHGKHHAGYVKNLNSAISEAGARYKKLDIESLLHKLGNIPSELRTSIRNNGGGHANHSLFWKIMGTGDGKPEGVLLEAIESKFTSVENFKDKFSEAAIKRFGSGWAWLVISGGKLKIYSTKNQDSPLMKGDSPILGIDVWEHAYYLKYQNRRADYISSWWNVVNWKSVGKIFKAATG